MAPFVGMKRKDVLTLLGKDDAAKRLPITLGMYSPQAVIRIEGHRWVLRELVLEKEREKKIEVTEPDRIRIAKP